MNIASGDTLRIIAIDPTPKGFGFAVLEGPRFLVDWGTKVATGGNKNVQCLKSFSKLLDQYNPEVIVAEDFRKNITRRPERTRELISQVTEVASRKRIKIRRFSRTHVRRVFGESGFYNKEEVAAEITNIFPELTPRLPRHRYPWMSEDSQMAIFDAIAFALTYFYFKSKRAKDELSTLGIESNHVQ